MRNLKEICSVCRLVTAGKIIGIAAAFLMLVLHSCKDKGCDYEKLGGIPMGCAQSDSLNLSTGLDTSGMVIAPAVGAVDPFWKLLNKPPLENNCTDPLNATISENAYVVNYFSTGSTGWVNQPGTGTLAPVDMGNTTSGFNCNNDTNRMGDRVPYIFERSFCVLTPTLVDFSFTYKGDDQVYFELIENSTGNVLSTGPTYVWTGLPIGPWTASALPLAAGSHSIRAYLVNTNGDVLGFSLLGNLTTTNGDLAISSNAAGCCENNTISVLNVFEAECDGQYDGGVDQVGDGWTFYLKDSGGATIRTVTTDINGNIFFSGLPDGTYTVESVPVGSWTPNVPAGGTITVTISGNTVKILEFFNCKG